MTTITAVEALARVQRGEANARREAWTRAVVLAEQAAGGKTLEDTALAEALATSGMDAIAWDRLVGTLRQRAGLATQAAGGVKASAAVEDATRALAALDARQRPERERLDRERRAALNELREAEVALRNTESAAEQLAKIDAEIDAQRLPPEDTARARAVAAAQREVEDARAGAAKAREDADKALRVACDRFPWARGDMPTWDHAARRVFASTFSDRHGDASDAMAAARHVFDLMCRTLDAEREVDLFVAVVEAIGRGEDGERERRIAVTARSRRVGCGPVFDA